jgi:predicted DNA-binding transcriptional regulator YafY
MKELDRILGILLLLQSQRRIPARQLAERFAVSTRTIYRDLQTMSLLGIPIYAERGRGGGVRLLEGYFLPPLMFSRSEAIALLLGIIMLRALRSVPFQQDVDTASEKLLAALPEHLRASLARFGQIAGVELPSDDIFHPEPDEVDFSENAQRDGVTVTRFLQALFDGETVRLAYQSPYREAERAIDAQPLGVFWDRGRWYLVGVAAERPHARRLWRADRVTAITSAGAPANARREDFDIGDLLGRAWLQSAMDVWRANAPVRLRVTAEQAQRLQRDWYYRFARYETGEDGAATMEFGEGEAELPLALVRWLGPGAELLSPEDWRGVLRAQLEAMLRQHE